MRLNTSIVRNQRIRSTSYRLEEKAGKQYIVAPVSMIVPGVLSGSKGALLYPSGEINRTVSKWTGVPIVINHPTDSHGNGISARAPGVFEHYGIGFVARAFVRNGKLVGEGWFDLERVRRKDRRIEAALLNGRPMEVSTGLFTENKYQPGHYGGKHYTYVASNYRPDHLAVLPDKKGACSVNDGCGLNMNSVSRSSNPLVIPTLNDEPSPRSCSCSNVHERDGESGPSTLLLVPRMSF